MHIVGPTIPELQLQASSPRSPQSTSALARWLTAVVCATFWGCGSDTPVPIPPPPPDPVATTLTVSPTSLEIDRGATGQIQGVVLDQFGKVMSTTISWSSQDNTIATVSNGTVTGTGIGNADVVARVSALTATSTVKVVLPPRPGVAAFPGAEGYGAWTLNSCNRDSIQVIRVSTLQPTGPGSFRDALDNIHPELLTFITFEVAGQITGSFRISASCVYVAGQTAPGGIQFYSDERAPITLREGNQTHDIVLRYLRVRSAQNDALHDALTVRGGKNVMLDHISTEFSSDELLSITPLAADVGGTDITEITLQRSIIAAGLRPKSLGSLIVGPNDHSTELKQISLHHNLWAHNAHRNPLVRGVTEGQLVNNVVYNWRNRVTRFGDSTRVDVTNNYYRAGPWSGNNSDQVLQHDTDNALSPLFLEGNVAIPLQPDPNANQQNLIRFAGTGAPLPPGLFATTRYANPRVPITESSAIQAWTDVLADVGANKRISCRGDWIPAQDALDQRIVSDALNHVGPSTDVEADDPSDFGGLPSFPPGSPCVDRDRDGMPDEFEIRYGLDPDDSSDNQQDPDRDGWVNMEEYVNGTDPNR